MSLVQVFENTLRKGEIDKNSPFLTVFSNLLENFAPFSSKLKLSAANSFNLESLKFVVWKRVKSLYETWSNGKKQRSLTRVIINEITKEILIIYILREVNPLPQHDDFRCPWDKKPFENIVVKGENAGKQHFLLFLQCFWAYERRI